MLLQKILHTKVVKTDLDAETKIEAIDELIDLLIQANALRMSQREEIREAVMQRELSHGTGMEHGIALPHAATDLVEDVVCALGISKKGVAFDCMDGQPARLLFLLLLPRQNFRGHVRTLAGVAHLLSNPLFRKQLAGAATSEEAVRLIAEEEGRYLQSPGPQ